jgi:hypothetical protein
MAARDNAAMIGQALTCAGAINDYCAWIHHLAQFGDDAKMAECVHTILGTSHAQTSLVLGQSEPSTMEIKVTAVQSSRAEVAYCSNNINLWEKIEAPAQYLKGRITTFCRPMFNAFLNRADQIMVARPDDYDGIGRDQMQLRRISAAVADLGQESSLNACCAALATRCLDLEFENRVRSKRNTDFLPMQNGALVLETKTLRVFEKEECVTRTLPFEFGPAVSADIAEVNDFLCTIQPDDASRNYLRTQMCIQMLDHSIKEVGVYLGPSNTGKTTCILLMKQLVGKEFAIKAANNYFTSSQRDAQQADSHLAQVDGKRLWYAEELPKEGTLQVERMKDATGGDDQRGRALYGNEADIKIDASLVLSMNEMMQFSTLVGMDERLYVLPFDGLTADDLSRSIKDDLKSDSSDRTQRWRLAHTHILVDHYQAVAKPTFFDDDTKVRPDMPNRVKLATQGVFAEANVVLAWAMQEDCPWEATDDANDMITYGDFKEAWNYEGHECPGPEIFSRLIRTVQRPGGGTVAKIAAGSAMVSYTNRAGETRRTRPFRYVRFRPEVAEEEDEMAW